MVGRAPAARSTPSRTRSCTSRTRSSRRARRRFRRGSGASAHTWRERKCITGHGSHGVFMHFLIAFFCAMDACVELVFCGLLPLRFFTSFIDEYKFEVRGAAFHEVTSRCPCGVVPLRLSFGVLASLLPSSIRCRRPDPRPHSRWLQTSSGVCAHACP